MSHNDEFLIEFKPLEKHPQLLPEKNTVYKNFRIDTPYNDSVMGKLKENDDRR